jgi:hypothetical protein
MLLVECLYRTRCRVAELRLFHTGLLHSIVVLKRFHALGLAASVMFLFIMPRS